MCLGRHAEKSDVSWLARSSRFRSSGDRGDRGIREDVLPERCEDRGEMTPARGSRRKSDEVDPRGEACGPKVVVGILSVVGATTLSKFGQNLARFHWIYMIFLDLQQQKNIAFPAIPAKFRENSGEK